MVQVDPMKRKLKPHGNKRLKLKCGLLLSTSAFKINLRRYRAAEGITHQFTNVVSRRRLNR